MKIHEYQARELMSQFGLPVPPAEVVDTPEQAAEAFKKLKKEQKIKLAVVKAQVHAGGRGKGGGVKLVKTAAEAKKVAKAILSKPLVTPQTGPQGVPVNKLLVAGGVDIAKEYYVGMAVDRGTNRLVLIASSEGGVEIEEVAKKNPSAIIRTPVDAAMGLQAHQARNIAFRLGFKGTQIRAAIKVMMNLAKLFLETDASLAEVNPLIITKPTKANPDGELLAIDAKISFDENAMFRQKQIQAYHDPTEEDPAEIHAAKFGLNFINLDGEIGCLVNGAGLAMATMDIVKLYGSEPANFLDVGGSATEEAVTEAFKIILKDSAVKGVLVNIFGGIMKCDIIAQAIANAAKSIGFQVPLVVRLEGTNVGPARKILEKASKDIPALQTATDLTDAAKKITSAVKAA